MVGLTGAAGADGKDGAAGGRGIPGRTGIIVVTPPPATPHTEDHAGSLHNTPNLSPHHHSGNHGRPHRYHKSAGGE